MLGKESFKSIRPFGGSQQGGFEELICQLAHLNPPPNAKLFVRKEGAGGDAGIECFWTMTDGSEHAWQAKYFLDSITRARWNQINASVETAIKKHPKLKKYYVCVPLDRTDTRSTRSGGKQTISALDEWNNYVEKWSKLASDQGMEVEFEYWGAHEILLPLQSDVMKYSGRALFWFNDVVFTKDKFQLCIEKQEKTLGERYTPEFHVDLPIVNILDGLINGDQFWSELNQKVLEWNKECSAFCRIKAPNEVADKLKELTDFLSKCRQVVDSVIITRDRSRLVELQKEVEEASSRLYEFENACGDFEEATKKPDQHSRSYRDEVFYFASRKHSQLYSFLNSNLVNANIASAVLVTGEAGVGKSHLLCDFAKRVVRTHGPAVLMLGQHYRGGNPLADLLDLLDLNEHSYETVLGAIDAAGESARGNSILVIDAINEGSHRDEWCERIVGLLEDLKRFPHISLLISCRSRFDDLLIPEKIKTTELLRISHEGFRGHEHKAASIYLSKQGIAKPTTPITAPEFSNPLFLKTCATALKQLGKTSWPKGYQGTSRLFEIYLSSLELIVSKRRKTELDDKLSQKALEAIANEMFPDHLFGLPRDKALLIVNTVDTAVNSSESLFQTLLREGAIAEDIEYFQDDGIYKPNKIVRFAYERFCDQFVAQKFLCDIKNPGDIFNEDHPIGKAVSEDKGMQFRGILAALAIIIPEKYGVEFWELLPENLKSHPQSEDFYFFDSLSYRSPSSFTDETRELFNSLQPFEYYRFQNRKLDLLVQFATEPSHPWNAESLHKLLVNQTMPERDSFWSVYVARNDFEEKLEDGNEQPESGIRSIIEWATFGDLTFIEEDQAFLSLVTLIWFTTTTNRKTRDQATKAASRMIARYPSLVVQLLTQFEDVDDLYLQERLYASAYGGLCNTAEDNHLKSAANHVFECQFRNKRPTEHLLLRDYARGIIELSISRNCLDESIIIDNCRPPYKSAWPLKNPLDSELSHFGNKIERSVFSDDFGRYTMSSVHDWSPTSLDQPKPESQAEVLESLCENLDKSSKELFTDAVRVTQAYEGRSRQYMFPDSQKLEQSPNSDYPTREDVDAAWEKFNHSLDHSEKEKFRWAQSFWRNEDIAAAFSRKWAKHWVCKHAIDLGWNTELFEEFENSLPYDGRRRPRIERIGKKYQRIAYHTFLAHLSDNVHYTGDEGYADKPKPSRYRGPWQPWERDIDPTHWLRKTSDSGWGEWDASVWWRPFDYKFALATDDAKQLWCQDSTNLPKFEHYIKISDNSKNDWYSMRGFSQWEEKEISGDVSSLTRDIWFRINSILVKQEDFPCLQRELKNEDFISPDFVSSTSTGYQVYLREYPWHPSVSIQDQFSENEYWAEIKSPHIVPYAEYEWEQGSGDMSVEMSISLYMPSSFLIKNMALQFDPNRFDCWMDDSGKTVFFDPSLEYNGPSFALLDCKSFDKMLSDKNLVLVWLIGGEKMVFDESTKSVKARMVFNTMLWTTGDGQVHDESRHYMEGSQQLQLDNLAMIERARCPLLLATVLNFGKR